MINPKIGFCCKMVCPDENANTADKRLWEEQHNQKGTTITHLKTLSNDKMFEKVWSICESNLSTLLRQFEYVASRPINLRMMRISSDFLPAATHQVASWIYQRNDITDMIANGFALAGAYARKHDIRLSFHPGQFVVPNNPNPVIVKNSADDFEYHTKMAVMMGYGNSFHDHGFEINIHAGGKVNGLDHLVNFIQTKLSRESRNLISIENDEFSFGLDDLLQLKDISAILLDVHHYWIKEENYIQPDDPRLDLVLESWRGIRPEMHYAISHEDLLVDHDINKMPNITSLLADNHKKGKLRAHSDFAWNKATNSYVLDFLDKFDLCFEGKMKNLSAQQLYDQALLEGKIFTNS